MKKILIILVAMMIGIGLSNAQIIVAEDVEHFNYEVFGSPTFKKIKFVDVAKSIADTTQLDKNNQITHVSICQLDSSYTKEKIYIEINNWFINSFNSGKSVIQLNDKESGTIIGKGHISNIVNHTNAWNSDNISIYIIIRCDIKDTKVRITTTIQEYEIERGVGSVGMIAAAFGGVSAMSSASSKSYFTYLPTMVYPFTKKEKKTGAKAYIMSLVYSKIIHDKIHAAVKTGINGNENDNW